MIPDLLPSAWRLVGMARAGGSSMEVPPAIDATIGFVHEDHSEVPIVPDEVTADTLERMNRNRPERYFEWSDRVSSCAATYSLAGDRLTLFGGVVAGNVRVVPDPVHDQVASLMYEVFMSDVDDDPLTVRVAGDELRTRRLGHELIFHRDTRPNDETEGAAEIRRDRG